MTLIPPAVGGLGQTKFALQIKTVRNGYAILFKYYCCCLVLRCLRIYTFRFATLFRCSIIYSHILRANARAFLLFDFVLEFFSFKYFNHQITTLTNLYYLFKLCNLMPRENILYHLNWCYVPTISAKKSKSSYYGVTCFT